MALARAKIADEANLVPATDETVVIDETIFLMRRKYRIVLQEVPAQRPAATAVPSSSGRPFHYHQEEKDFRLQLERQKVRSTEGRSRLWY